MTKDLGTLRLINDETADTVATAFEAVAREVRDQTGSARAAGYLAIVVRLDGGVDLRWAGREISLLGALEVARVRICTRWFEDG